MKKSITFLCLILMIFSLVACKQSGSKDNVIVEVGQSTKFSKKEINAAMDCVIDNFEFPACTLKKVLYDEEKSNTLISGYLSNGRGSVNGVKAENVIILLSTFYVDGSGNNPVLNPDSTYTDYQWILIRDSKTSKWKIDDQGY